MWANHVMQIEGIPSQTLRDFVYAAYVEAAEIKSKHISSMQHNKTFLPFFLFSNF